jgi:hypothetical protein
MTIASMFVPTTLGAIKSKVSLAVVTVLLGLITSLYRRSSSKDVNAFISRIEEGDLVRTAQSAVSSAVEV